MHDDGSGPALFAGGGFGNAGRLKVNHVARWDGRAWSDLGGGLEQGTVASADALAVYDDGRGSTLYVGGIFATAGGVVVNNIARWDGGTWRPLRGSSGIAGTDGRVRTLTVYDDSSGPALYVGGFFTTAGEVSTGGIARWGGKTWSGLGSGVWEARALTVWDDGGGPSLYVGGWFGTAGGVASSNMAAWSRNGVTVFVDGFESGDTSAWSGVVP